MVTALESVYKAWLAALVASEDLIALVPEAKIYMGPRKSDAPVPCISITISEATQSSTQGVKNAKLGYREAGEAVIKIEVDGTLKDILPIYEQIYLVVLQGNATLNAAVKQITKLRKDPEYYNDRGLLEGNLTFGFSYIWEI